MKYQKNETLFHTIHEWKDFEYVAHLTNDKGPSKRILYELKGKDRWLTVPVEVFDLFLSIMGVKNKKEYMKGE